MSPENSGQRLNYAAARVLRGPKVELDWVVEGNWPRQARAQGGRWPACIMDAAKYVSAAGAEWRRWRTTARRQPIGCPRVMHITLPPAPQTLTTSDSPPKKSASVHPLPHPPFPPQHLPRSLKRPPEGVRLSFSQLKLVPSLCSRRLMEDAFRTARGTHSFLFGFPFQCQKSFYLYFPFDTNNADSYQ